MAFEVMAWAVKQDVPNSGAKLVLLLLANHTNGHTGQCNPSQSLLAKECCMGLSTLRRHLADLEESGFISVVHQYAENMKRPNQYIVNFQGSPQESMEEQNRAIDHPNRRYPPSKSEEPLPPNRMIETGSKNSNVNKPEDVSSSVWQEFLEHRKSRKAKVTPLVMEIISKEAKKAGWALEDAIKEIIVRNWQSFKAEWVNNSKFAFEKPASRNTYESLL